MPAAGAVTAVQLATQLTGSSTGVRASGWSLPVRHANEVAGMSCFVCWQVDVMCVLSVSAALDYLQLWNLNAALFAL